MDEQLDEAKRAAEICQKLKQYFGDNYDVSSNNVDVFTLKSNLEKTAYIESQDLTVVGSIAEEYGLVVESWRIVVANQQMGLYCVMVKQDEADIHFR